MNFTPNHMKTFIVKEEQLENYINNKKNEKVVDLILETIENNKKFLNENISLKKTNQTYIDDLKRKNVITPEIREMLISRNIINENNEII